MTLSFRRNKRTILNSLFFLGEREAQVIAANISASQATQFDDDGRPEDNPRQRGDDDGVEYADPGDKKRGLED